MTAERIISGTANEEEEAVELAIRPRRLAEYIGQGPVKTQLEIFISAARGRGEALDHVLIFGPPGLGKTTLAHIIAAELGASLRQTSGPVLERPGDLAALLTNLQARDVLFVDEIHRLSPVVEEILYPAMEDYQLDIMIGEGPAARSIKLNLPPFTLVGATTRAGLLTSRLGCFASCAPGVLRHRGHRRRSSRAAAGGDRRTARRIAQRARYAAHRQPPVVAARDYARVRADGHREACHPALTAGSRPRGADTLDRKPSASSASMADQGIDSRGGAREERVRRGSPSRSDPAFHPHRW